MSFYSFLFVLFCIGLLLILTFIGWWIYIHTSPFHIAVNRIPGPANLPLIGNTLEIAGGLEGSTINVIPMHHSLITRVQRSA